MNLRTKYWTKCEYCGKVGANRLRIDLEPVAGLAFCDSALSLAACDGVCNANTEHSQQHNFAVQYKYPLIFSWISYTVLAF